MMLKRLVVIKEAVLTVGVTALLFMAIHYNTELGKQTVTTKEIVQSQSNILNAIRQVTSDTNVTAQQQTAIIICMLQVPLQNRTTDVLKDCRAASVSSSATGSNAQSISGSASSSSRSSSTNSTANEPTAQSDIPPTEQSSTGVLEFLQPVINSVNRAINTLTLHQGQSGGL